MNIFRSKHVDKVQVYFALLLAFLLPFIGTIGYITIEGYSLLDAVYMTVITIATVGYSEVHELSDSGKLFTVILIVISLATYAYVLTVITTHLFEGRINKFFNQYRTKFNGRKMKNHIIVVGYGRNGKQVVKELTTRNRPYIVIETDHELIMQYSTQGVCFYEGDATEDQVLIEAGVLNASALITALPNDADNLFVTLTARSINRRLCIISRASNESAEKKLRTAGANHVIIPEKVGGAHMAVTVLQPDIVNFLELLSFQEDTSASLVEVVCNDLPQEYWSKTIGEIDIRKQCGANIIGFKTAAGDILVNPNPDTVLIPNTKLFVLGTAGQIKDMKSIFKL